MRQAALFDACHAHLCATGSRRAAQVCRSAGYFEHALAVAQAAGEPEWCLEILLEDCRQYDEALDFLRGLPSPQAAAALHRHGKARLARR